MMKIAYVGLDVHADSIAVAVAEGGRGGELRSLGVVRGTAALVKLVGKAVGGGKRVRYCYEAGPTGYALYWELTKLGF